MIEHKIKLVAAVLPGIRHKTARLPAKPNQVITENKS
jgi:hypothetical protein